MINYKAVILLLSFGIYFSCQAQDRKEIFIEFIPNDSTIYKKQDTYYIDFLYFKKDNAILSKEMDCDNKTKIKTISVEKLRESRGDVPLIEYYKNFDYWIIEKGKNERKKLVKVIFEGYIINDNTIED